MVERHVDIVEVVSSILTMPTKRLILFDLKNILSINHLPGNYCERAIPDPFRTRSQAFLRRWYFALRYGRVGRCQAYNITMHIFITGVAGFLGSNLADYYLKKGFKISGCDNLVGGDMENVSSDVIFYKGDCENLEFMTNATKDNVNVLCHAAAYAHEGLSSISPTLICNNNVTGSVSTFTSAIRNKIKRIVYCSSMARYGNIKIPFSEEDQLNPVDPYGVSKVAAENILKILCQTHGVEYNIAVPHNIIGPKQKYDDPYRNVVSIMANLMLQNRQPIIYGNGEQKKMLFRH